MNYLLGINFHFMPPFLIKKNAAILVPNSLNLLKKGSMLPPLNLLFPETTTFNLEKVNNKA